MTIQHLTVKARVLRAITYLPNGQRCLQWLPQGTYDIVGDCILDERQATKLKQAVVYGKPHTGTQTWYISRD